MQTDAFSSCCCGAVLYETILGVPCLLFFINLRHKFHLCMFVYVLGVQTHSNQELIMPSSCTALAPPIIFLSETLAVDVVRSHRYIRSVPGCLFLRQIEQGHSSCTASYTLKTYPHTMTELILAINALYYLATLHVNKINVNDLFENGFLSLFRLVVTGKNALKRQFMRKTFV